MRVLAITTALLLAPAFAAQAQGLDCIGISAKLEQVTRLAQSCSDAASKRNDIQEADAICATVFPASRAVWPSPDADVKFAKACPAQAAAFERHLTGLAWVLNWNKWRTDGSGKTPAPLTINLPAGR